MKLKKLGKRSDEEVGVEDDDEHYTQEEGPVSPLVAEDREAEMWEAIERLKSLDLFKFLADQLEGLSQHCEIKWYRDCE